jgi:hypothetical protein
MNYCHAVGLFIDHRRRSLCIQTRLLCTTGIRSGCGRAAGLFSKRAFFLSGLFWQKVLFLTSFQGWWKCCRSHFKESPIYVMILSTKSRKNFWRVPSGFWRVPSRQRVFVERLFLCMTIFGQVCVERLFLCMTILDVFLAELEGLRVSFRKEPYILLDSFDKESVVFRTTLQR